MEAVPLKVYSLKDAFASGKTVNGKTITHPIVGEALAEISGVQLPTTKDFPGALVGGMAAQAWLYSPLSVNKNLKYLRKTYDMEFILPPHLEKKDYGTISKSLEFLGECEVKKGGDGVYVVELNYDEEERPLRVSFYNGVENAKQIIRALKFAQELPIPEKESVVPCIRVEDIIASKAKRLRPKDIYDIQLLNLFYGRNLDIDYMSTAMDEWGIEKIVKLKTIGKLELF